MTDAQYDMNRDPITDEPGSHPVSTGVGSAGGAAAGALVGGMFGPIGMLIGGGIGAVAGGSAGHAIGEKIDPTGEIEYWREQYPSRDYYNPDHDFERDLVPAYRYGWEARSANPDRNWDDKFEAEIKEAWKDFKEDSFLPWELAHPAVQDAWSRTDNTYRAYHATDRFFSDRYETADYYDEEYDFDDYRQAYRFGTYCRTRYPERDWDDRLEDEIKDQWEEFKGNSRLAWEKAKHAAKDAWHSVERALPGDFDNDGR